MNFAVDISGNGGGRLFGIPAVGFKLTPGSNLPTTSRTVLSTSNLNEGRVLGQFTYFTSRMKPKGIRLDIVTAECTSCRPHDTDAHDRQTINERPLLTRLGHPESRTTAIHGSQSQVR